MYTNRIFYMLVALALIAVMFFTFREAVSTAAIAQADRSYDAIEHLRLGVSSEDRSFHTPQTSLYRPLDLSFHTPQTSNYGVPAGVTAPDSSYDQVEAVRLGRSGGTEDQGYSQVETLRSQRGAPFADRSYDAIESLRVARETK